MQRRLVVPICAGNYILQTACTRTPDAERNDSTVAAPEVSALIADSSCSPISEITRSTRGMWH
jgi:hypothetical protein